MGAMIVGLKDRITVIRFGVCVVGLSVAVMLFAESGRAQVNVHVNARSESPTPRGVHVAPGDLIAIQATGFATNCDTYGLIGPDGRTAPADPNWVFPGRRFQ